MDDSSNYDNADFPDQQTFPGVSSTNSSIRDLTDQEEYLNDSTPSQQKHGGNFYSSLTLQTRPIIYSQVSNGSDNTTPRSYPKVIVSLCIVAGIVIPPLSPFVFYFLFQSRLDWSKGNYNKSYRRVNQAANVTLAGVVILIMLFLITILTVGVIALQQSSDYSVNPNTSYKTAELDKSELLLKSKLLNMTTPTVLTSILERSRTSESENNIKTISQSEQQSQTGKLDDVPTNVAPNSYKPTSDNQYPKKTIQNTDDAMINFDTLKNNNYEYKKINDTEGLIYNPITHQNHTVSLRGFTLPNQQK